jgi:hypothetical protein
LVKVLEREALKPEACRHAFDVCRVLIAVSHRLCRCL